MAIPVPLIRSTLTLSQLVRCISDSEVPQVLFRLSRWENLEHAEEV